MEEQYLNQTISVAQEQLSSARTRGETSKAEIVSAKREMREVTSHSIGNLWSAEGFEDLVELSQFSNPISEKVFEYEANVKTILSLEKLIESPYFARIDFKFDEDDEVEKVYIGRSSLIDDKSQEMYVYDWRSPIASVFYRFGTGRALYDAPAGTITGQVNLKRQYEIEKSKLEYFFDADVQIIDEFLRKLLSQNASSKMKTIVETIQRDQDAIIRDMESDLMMVQGAAGSGKTSVALHRVAYLMYQGLSKKLSHQDVVVISPNTLFEQYISGVLPELGEENVNSIVFEEILRRVLRKQPIQTKNQFLDQLLSSVDAKQKDILKRSMEFKGSSQFVEIIKRFKEDLRKFTKPDYLELYRKLFGDKDRFIRLAEGIELPDCIEDIIEVTRENLRRDYLHYDDGLALAYLHLKAEGCDDYLGIKQVVIDEAQDYYPIHFEILRPLFSNARYTILGDINQTIEKQADLSLYDQVRTILGKSKSTLVTLDKSFRCTTEILTYSTKFLDQGFKLNSFSRKGEAPAVFTAESRPALDNMIAAEIRDCREKGYQSIALICKTEEDALSLYGRLKDKIDIRLIKSDVETDLQGVFVMPVYMSKGLEFDAVLICDADNDHYNTEDDKNILYIACTRALHRLNLFYTGEISPLL